MSLTISFELLVVERVAHGTENYAPGNLPSRESIVITSSRHHSLELLEQRARNLEHVLQEVQNPTSLLSDVKDAIFVATAAYYIYIVVWTFILISVVWALLAAIGVAMPLISSFKVLAIALGGFGLAYVIQTLASKAMTTLFSRFWHGVQPHLREALKQARRAVNDKRAA